MNRMKSLLKKLNELNNENSNLDIRVENLRKRKKNECKLILEKYFGKTYGDYSYDISSERVSVKYKDNRYSIVDLYFYTSWKGENMSYDKIELSMPSFRPDNIEVWIIDRFQMLTSITSIVVTNEKSIINDLNSILIKYDNLTETFRDDMRYLRDTIKVTESDISILKKENMIEKLFDVNGISLVTDENDNNLPSLQLKWDWNMNSVSGIKATKMSASGKSVDLEVRTRFRDYNSNEFQFKTTQVEKVRFDNVESFLRRNEKMIG